MRQDELLARIHAHREWIQTAGERGSQMDLDNCDLTVTNLADFPFEQAYLAECRMNGLHFENVDFFESEFYSCDFTGACFVGCSFRKATLEYCDFKRARFIHCQFPRMEAYQSCFTECSFEGCSFVGINLMESDLSRASLIGIDWDEAYLDQVKLHAAEGRGSKNISTIIQPKISIDPTAENWLEGKQAIEWLQAHMNHEC